MFNKKCPTCGAGAKMDTNHLAHDVHVGHNIHQFIHHNPFFKSHPVAGLLGNVGLLVAGAVKLMEKHHYKCENGHRFEA